MKTTILLITVGLLTACAPTTEQHFASIEQQRCPKSKFSSYTKKAECVQEVRKELAAHNLEKSQ